MIPFSMLLLNSECCDKHPPEFTSLHFCGVPGGEVYRGSYYLRAGLLFPSRAKHFDYKLFGRLKFLLDYVPGLTRYDDKAFIGFIHNSLRRSIETVDKFPTGTQVDHLLRDFQNSTWGLWGLYLRQPFYLPLGLKNLTKSIYNVPPSFKSSGKIVRAATELLFRELAYTKTQYNVPTIRRTIIRLPLFLPGYYTSIKKILRGALRRVGRFQQQSKTLASSHRLDQHGPTMKTLLEHKPYSRWFESTSTMITGDLYNSKMLNQILFSLTKVA